MRNTYSKGSEYQHLFGPPCNEDYGLLVEVTAADRDIVTGKKIWDEGTRSFSAKNTLKFVPDVGSFVIFRRCGNDDTSASWICLAPRHVCLVEDVGSDEDGRKGREVYYDAAKSLVVIDPNERTLLRSSEPLSNYHASTPPWATGRVYVAMKENGYYNAILPGHGSTEKTISNTVGLNLFSIDVDAQGNVLSFSATAPGEATDELWLWNYSAHTWTQGTQAGDVPPATYGHIAWQDSATLYLLSVDGFFSGSISGTEVTWTQLDDPPFTYARYSSTAESVTDVSIQYVCIGTGFWKYDSGTPAWTELATASYDYLDDTLSSWPYSTIYYVIPAGAKATSDVEKYQISIDTWGSPGWKSGTVYPTAGTRSAGKHRYISGGSGDSDQLFLMSLDSTNHLYWTQKANMPEGRQQHMLQKTSTSSTTGLWVFGGVDDSGTRSAKTFEYAIATATWSDVTPGTTPPATAAGTFTNYSATYAMLWGGIVDP